MHGEVKYLHKMRRRAGSAPHHLPRSADGVVGGGGGGRLASCVLPGDLEQGRGIFGLRVWRVTFACGFGVFPWQAILACLLGGSIWLVKLAHSFKDLGARKTCC